jgi:hypothetical protein
MIVERIIIGLVILALIWWAFMVLFSLVIRMTWGYKMQRYSMAKTAIFQLLATIVLNSDEKALSFEEVTGTEQAMFLFLFILITYSAKLCALCQATSLLLEQNRMYQKLQDTVEQKDVSHYQYFKDWLTFSIGRDNAKYKKKARRAKLAAEKQ